MKLCLIVLVLVAGVLSLKAFVSAIEARHGSSERGEAYVTLFYGDNLLSVRVLGLSLKLTCTQREMVVLCTDEVSEENRKLLEDDGWTVKLIKSIYKKYLEQFDTKFSIWTLTEYRRIVYLSLIHISEPTRRYAISYAVFCLKKKN